MESIDTLKTKLTAIGKSIRNVRKEFDTYTLDEMPEKIRTLTMGSEAPDYTDGKDHYLIDIVAGEEFPVYIYYYIPSGGTLTIEWGDGTTDTVSGANKDVETEHAYEDIGSYEIKVSCDQDGWYPYGTTTKGVLGQCYTDSCETGRYLSLSRLSEIHLADRTMELNDLSFGMFYRLVKFTIPSGVTSIGNNAFYSCSSLTSITIPSGVTSIGSDAFSYCSSLTSITIPSGVTSIGDFAFYSCFSLTSITIPSGVTSIGDYAFSCCSSLTSITIPSGVTSIGDSAFSYCKNLEYIELKSATPPTLSSSNAFNSTNNCPIYVPDESVDTYKTATYWSSLARRIYGISEKGE